MSSEPFNKSVLDGVPSSIPTMDRTTAMLTEAAEIGFRFDNAEQAKQVFLKEITEFLEDPNKDEFGDMLHSLISWGRMAVPEISAEEALRHANEKFEARFRLAEQYNRENPAQNLGGWLAHWKRAKKELAPKAPVAKP